MALDNQVMSRAISLYMDRVTLSLGALQELEKVAKAVGERRQARILSASPDEGTDNAPSVDPQGSLDIAPLLRPVSYMCMLHLYMRDPLALPW